MRFRIAIVLLGCALTAAPSPQAGTWTSLFDGKTLTGWRVDRQGRFTVEDGMIVGRQGPKHLPGDLFTNSTWDNFELELEWKVEGPAESGIWFRRTVIRTGYQADLNDGKRSDGVLSGSLWCYGKQFLAVNRDRKSANHGGWNRMRVRAAGPDITNEQNGKIVAQARDRTYRTGSIGIQIPDGKSHAGMVVYVRNVRIRALGGPRRNPLIRSPGSTSFFRANCRTAACGHRSVPVSNRFP